MRNDNIIIKSLFINRNTLKEHDFNQYFHKSIHH